METPDPQYLRTEDGVEIAYQVIGEGPVDVCWQLDFVGNLDIWWDGFWERAWFEGLSSFARLILHDIRGMGLSSRNVPMPNLETRAQDIQRVLDAVGSERPLIGGFLESAAPCVLLAAAHPSRVGGLIWAYPYPRTTWAPDYEWAPQPDAVARDRQMVADHWGTITYGRYWASEEMAKDYVGAHGELFARQMARATRNACTPAFAVDLGDVWRQTDVRAVLPTVQVPTLLIAERESEDASLAEYVASLMPTAELAWVPHRAWPANHSEAPAMVRPWLTAIQRFAGVAPLSSIPDTVLATVLFTDIVRSTERQAELGDHEWKRVVELHHAAVREALQAWRGVEQDTAGDGFYATFDGPARAIRCGLAICEAMRDVGVEVRAGVHTGECELVDGKVGGIAVSIGARVAALSEPSQVLVSQTVKDLVAGSGFTFTPRGEHELRGVPDRWRVFAAAGDIA